MKKSWVWIGLVIAAAVVIAVIATRRGGSSGEIRIGAVLPLTGDAAGYGESAKKGIDLAVAEINEAGGVSGRKIRVIYEDSQADPRTGVTAMQKLTNVDKPVAVIGDLVSSVTLAIAPIANDKRVALLSPASSSPKLTDAGDFIFRNCPSDIYEGSIMGNYAYDKLGFKKVAILFVNNDYGVGIKNVFRNVFSEKGGNVITEEPFDQEATDLRAQLTKIKNANPQAIYLVGYKEMGFILKQARELGIQSQFLSTVTFEDPEILTIAQDSAEGVIYSASAFSPDSGSPVIRAFVDAFTKRYSQSPDIFAGLSYDAMKILAIALAKSDLTGEGLKAALYKVKGYPGVAGETSFDTNGDAVLNPVIKTVKDGKFVFVE